MTDDGLAPPAVVLKENEAETLSLPATRSTAAIENETAVTAPPITPLAADSERAGSALVCTVTPPPAVGLPSWKSSSVIVAVVAAANVPPDITKLVVEPGAKGI